MNLLAYITAVVCRVKRLQLVGVANIPTQGPALIAAEHCSPLDLFYYLRLMRAVGRQQHHFVMAAELVDEELFRPYVRSAIRVSVPHLAVFSELVAQVGSRIIPPLLRPLHPIPVYRQGDDAAARDVSLGVLLAGHLLTIAPGWGDDRHRDSNGVRPMRHSVASLARRFFDATGAPLAVIPIGLGASGRGIGSRTYVRVGEPFRNMSDQHYPTLFSAAGRESEAVKYEAYQDFTRQLAGRIAALC